MSLYSVYTENNSTTASLDASGFQAVQTVEQVSWMAMAWQ